MERLALHVVVCHAALDSPYSYCTDTSSLELCDVCNANTVHLELIDFCVEQLVVVVGNVMQ